MLVFFGAYVLIYVEKRYNLKYYYTNIILFVYVQKKFWIFIKGF